MKNKILLLFTGGTIGSSTKDSIINIDSSARYHLLEKYAKFSDRNGVSFDIYEPLSILSENLIPSDWTSLIDSIKSKPLDEYSGIIVTHGTDTLPYTSAVLSYAFNALSIPLVVVASNSPLGESESNGLHNFIAAVNFISDAAIPGIFVVYQNATGESIVHLGSRLTEALPFTHQFRSQKDAYFGKMIGEKFIHNKSATYSPSITEILNREVFTFDTLSFSDQILCITPYPGLNYAMFDFSVSRPKAVLHDLYHSGTACVRLSDANNQYSLLNFVHRCKSKNIDFYVAPLSVATGTRYATSAEFLDAGVIPMPDISTEAAIAKLSLAYGSFQDRNTIQEFLNRDIFFEFIRATQLKSI